MCLFVDCSPSKPHEDLPGSLSTYNVSSLPILVFLMPLSVCALENLSPFHPLLGGPAHLSARCHVPSPLSSQGPQSYPVHLSPLHKHYSLTDGALQRHALCFEGHPHARMVADYPPTGERREPTDRGLETESGAIDVHSPVQRICTPVSYSDHPLINSSNRHPLGSNPELHLLNMACFCSEA